jgi:hypothetical protein
MRKGVDTVGGDAVSAAQTYCLCDARARPLKQGELSVDITQKHQTSGGGGGGEASDGDGEEYVGAHSGWQQRDYHRPPLNQSGPGRGRSSILIKKRDGRDKENEVDKDGRSLSGTGGYDTHGNGSGSGSGSHGDGDGKKGSRKQRRKGKRAAKKAAREAAAAAAGGGGFHGVGAEHMGSVTVSLLDVVRDERRRADGSVVVNRYYPLQNTPYGGVIQMTIDVRPAEVS